MYIVTAFPKLFSSQRSPSGIAVAVTAKELALRRAVDVDEAAGEEALDAARHKVHRPRAELSMRTRSMALGDASGATASASSSGRSSSPQAIG